MSDQTNEDIEEKNSEAKEETTLEAPEVDTEVSASTSPSAEPEQDEVTV